MKRVLFIAYYFPPVSTSGSMRPLGFCRYLPEYGWLPEVIAVDPAHVPRLQNDLELCRRLPQAIPVYRLGHFTPIGRAAAALRRFRLLSAGQVPSEKTKGVSRPDGRGLFLRKLLVGLAERSFDFPDRQRFWYGPALKTGLEIARKRRPNVVLATGNPWTSLLVGSALASRLGVPFIADFRDPWLHNPFRTRSPFIDRRIRALEKKTVSSAARVIANTRELQMQFESEYPELRERMLTLTNGFDYPPPISRTGDARSDPELFELCHFGSIYGKRVPRALLDALSIMAERRPFDIHKLRVRFVGQWEVDDPRIEERVSRLEKIGVVKRESRLPHDTCLQMMRTADALLVLQSESNLQIPAKLFEYAWAQRPVLVIGGEGATAQLVTRAGLGVCVPPTVESVSQLIDSLLEQRTVLPTPTADAVQPFHYRALTRQLSQVLDEVVSARD